MSVFQNNLVAPIWGGWVTGPTLIGPEEFARAGYDYVGFDTQHGYLDDADVAGLLRRLEHVPIATAVRLPNADPPPIGRVLDALVRIHRSATDAGLVTGIHASDGKTGNELAQLGFQMITLASEAQALRRGAAQHLGEATAQ